MKNETFKKGLLSVLEMNNITTKPEWFINLWSLLKNDFTDDEFYYACDCILKNEELYGKPPPPRLFYKYKPKTELSRRDEVGIACREFIDKCSGYFGGTFYPKDFAQNLTETERRTLKEFGRLQDLRWSVNPENDYQSSLTKLLKELTEAFNNNYNLKATQQNVIEYRNKNNQSRVNDITKTLSKTMGA